MTKDVLESLIHVAVLLPFLFLCLKKDLRNKAKLISLFVIYFLGLQILLKSPFHFSSLNFIEGSWNWSGKIFAIVGSLFFYLFFKKNFYPHHFLTIRQEKKSLKKIFTVISVIAFIAIIEGFLFYNKSWDWETILFQSTLPGIDEEIAFRGIMLGILSSILVDEIRILNINIYNPSIWIIGILFGLIHALKLNLDWKLTFDIVYFIKTFLLGTIWGWMAIKSRSILLPLISHNLSNTLPNLIGMIK